MNRHSMPFMRKGGRPRCRALSVAPAFPCDRCLRPFAALPAATTGSALLPLVAPCGCALWPLLLPVAVCGPFLWPSVSSPSSCGASLAATSGTSGMPLVAVCISSRLALSSTTALCAAFTGPPASPTATGSGRLAFTCGPEAVAGGFTRFFALLAYLPHSHWRTWRSVVR